MSRLMYLISLSVSDIVRLWSSTQHQVVIVAGICLPILLLMGLKRGHVTELRQELITSPTGRQVVFWSAQHGALLSSDEIDKIFKEIPSVDVVIPDTQRLVVLPPSPRPSTESSELSTSDVGSLNVTLYSTSQGDPILAQYHLDLLEKGERSVLLSETVMKKHQYKVGDSVPVRISRSHRNVRESHEMSVNIRGSVPSSDESGLSGYANIELLNNLERYVHGYGVPELDLPAVEGLSAEEKYNSYLLFCIKGVETDLQESDLRYFAERGIQCHEITDSETKSLYGILSKDRLEEFVVYRITQVSTSDSGPASMRYSPLHIVNNTQALDDFALRWNEPRYVEYQGKMARLIGISLPTVMQTGGWVRDYLVESALVFDFEDSAKNPFTFVTSNNQFLSESVREIRLHLDSEVSIVLDRLSEEEEGNRGIEVPPEVPSAKGAETEIERSAQTVNISNGEIPENEMDSDSDGQSTIETASTTDETVSSSKSDAKHTAKQEAAILRFLDSTERGEQQQVDLDSLPSIVVPANLLAFLNSKDRSEAVFDSVAKRFTPVPQPIVFNKARLYAKTIDDVPDAVAHLRKRGFAVLSESARIAEIHQQDRSLQLLVYIVAGGVFLFGILTVISVLVDSTDRKRGTVGILRVMGMSPQEVFFVVIFRAVMIGLLAAITCVLVGYALASILSLDGSDLPLWISWKPSIAVILHYRDLAIVALGALVCSGLGAVTPALRASRIDPFDAIVEGRFH